MILNLKLDEKEWRNELLDMTAIEAVLKNDLGVKDQYRHAAKRVTPAGPFFPGKEYPGGEGAGLVILHRCGNDFYFLIVNTWRGSNEVWETVFYKDGEAMADFALWPRDGMHKPTYCVWELAPVWHEKESWERFLVSARDEAAAQVWQRYLYAGVA
jgi:hypothetical protein